MTSSTHQPSPSLPRSQLLCCFLAVLTLPVSGGRCLSEQQHSWIFNTSTTAILVFGDSTVDPGNNNFIPTVFRSNFPPYGRDFLNHEPTGRFTNGRLATDYIASYAGIKELIPPYLDPNLEMKDLLTGVSFASAGSGFDPLTPAISNVIPVRKQLDYLKEYKKRVELGIGKDRAEAHMKKAAFVVSAGTNDFVLNYFLLPFRRQIYSVSSYQRFVIQLLMDFLQGLWEEGGRRIAVVGLPPIGCLPIVITLNLDKTTLPRGCVESYSAAARGFNQILRMELKSMQSKLAKDNVKFFYVDSYEPLADMIHNFHNYGFEEAGSGCCGSGYVEASFLCNPKTDTCPDASKYVFWDSIHPTQATYHNIFLAGRPIVDAMLKH
ncbi:GDSL esterase/lipase At5g45960-like isoform X1 [Cucurbita maxima]|uniref:GDSL esterase/lipase At5g45960-like isoform X1 n=1 Tax=Cucurbita maxima TaxID=3661 RepID=A0A6J1IUT9_CUCMA|nr:GDSL esterase/lipase At5g45960-like isoform X1 [Cucurbita maxima]